MTPEESERDREEAQARAAENAPKTKKRKKE